MTGWVSLFWWPEIFGNYSINIIPFMHNSAQTNSLWCTDTPTWLLAEASYCRNSYTTWLHVGAHPRTISPYPSPQIGLCVAICSLFCLSYFLITILFVVVIFFFGGAKRSMKLNGIDWMVLAANCLAGDMMIYRKICDTFETYFHEELVDHFLRLLCITSSCLCFIL